MHAVHAVPQLPYLHSHTPAVMHANCDGWLSGKKRRRSERQQSRPRLTAWPASRGSAACCLQSRRQAPLAQPRSAFGCVMAPPTSAASLRRSHCRCSSKLLLALYLPVQHDHAEAEHACCKDAAIAGIECLMWPLLQAQALSNARDTCIPHAQSCMSNMKICSKFQAACRPPKSWCFRCAWCYSCNQLA